MGGRRRRSNPLHRFYVLALLGPVAMLSGLLLRGPVTDPGLIYDQIGGMQALAYRLYELAYWLVVTVGPTALVIMGLGLPLIGAVHARERLIGRVRRGPIRDKDLWPIYVTALTETLLLFVLFSHLISAGT